MSASEGYLNEAYAASLAEFGTPMSLPRSGGWLLRRQIPGSSCHDASGCYPLFACSDWRQLATDLGELGDDLVSVSVVTDPFGDYDMPLLRECFPHLTKSFKRHMAIDLGKRPETFVSRHHQRYARKALRQLHVERCAEPVALLDEWTELYSVLVKRHGITGIAGFSRLSFSRQLAVPGIVVLRATYGERTIGMLLWYVQGDVAHYHLGAHSELGYELRASFALFWLAIEVFAGAGLRWMNLGAGPGVTAGESDGLTRFKRGWSNASRQTYLCGRIFDQRAYRSITRAAGNTAPGYFPAYRTGEFSSRPVERCPAAA
jgi:Acetyltransferase (GNAT) domain